MIKESSETDQLKTIRSKTTNQSVLKPYWSKKLAAFASTLNCQKNVFSNVIWLKSICSRKSLIKHKIETYHWFVCRDWSINLLNTKSIILRFMNARLIFYWKKQMLQHETISWDDVLLSTIWLITILPNIFRAWDSEKDDVNDYKNVISDENELCRIYNKNDQLMLQKEKVDHINILNSTNFVKISINQVIDLNSDNDKWLKITIENRLVLEKRRLVEKKYEKSTDIKKISWFSY